MATNKENLQNLLLMSQHNLDTWNIILQATGGSFNPKNETGVNSTGSIIQRDLQQLTHATTTMNNYILLTAQANDNYSDEPHPRLYDYEVFK